MSDKKQQKILGKIAPELFLKQVLSGSYELVENNNVYYVDDAVVLQEIVKSTDVDLCRTIDDFKSKLVLGKPNLLIDRNLLNKVLLKELAATSSQSKNIILGDF